MNEKKRTEISELGQFGLIDRLTADITPAAATTLKGAGDDAAVIAADARAGLFGPVRLARPSACLGEISGGRINGGASPPFVRVKAEDSSLKNIRL